MSTWCCSGVLAVASVFIAGCGASSSSPYELDFDNPANVAITRQFTNGISEVRLYMTGPKQGFDTYRTLAEILAMPAKYTTHDQTQISQLLDALGDFDPTVRNEGVGYTYHIILFEAGTFKVMHFHVFSKDIFKEAAAMIHPRSNTGFGYSSRKIVPWLRSALASGEAGRF